MEYGWICIRKSLNGVVPFRRRPQVRTRRERRLCPLSESLDCWLFAKNGDPGESPFYSRSIKLCLDRKLPLYDFVASHLQLFGMGQTRRRLEAIYKKHNVNKDLKGALTFIGSSNDPKDFLNPKGRQAATRKMWFLDTRFYDFTHPPTPQFIWQLIWGR